MLAYVGFFSYLCTRFRRSRRDSLWQKLFTIFYGQTKTYSEIAEMVNCKSARAIGHAIGRNPIALIIPCHRVVGANGTLGGYAYGPNRKKQLLELEK